MENVTQEKIALVAVHGVARHPRYEFQDQVAGDLCRRLNEVQRDAWAIDVVNPGNVLRPGEDDPQPTISRVHKKDDDVVNPKDTYFDVMEAYWSAIDKGRTNWLSIVGWLLRLVFAPFNTTARLNAGTPKQFFDYAYIGGALALAFGLFFVSISAVWQSFLRILDVTGILRHSAAGDVLLTLDSNADAPGGVPIKIVVWLFVGFLGAFLVSEAMSAIVKIFQQRSGLRHNPDAVWHRSVAIAILAISGSALVYAMAVARFAHGALGWRGIVFLILIFVAFSLGRSLLIDFLVGFFGDVQIYTTRDENDSKFYDLRDGILRAATNAIINAISPEVNGGRNYDRVIVLTHSLGATIAMDAIVRAYQLAAQGALTNDQFLKIRAFVTAGSSLEKTRYFFDSSGRSPALSFEQWRNDAYGSLFTCDPAALGGAAGKGIFWANYWYFQDPICNEIRSYRSYLKPGESLDTARSLRLSRTGTDDWDDGEGDRPICRNERGNKHITLFHPMLHSDYLDDDWFWRSSPGHVGALDIIAFPANATQFIAASPP
ncbi:MAG: hypothetical protein M3R51_09180 [Candidatus Eremiobacteraeota bacterium]|nr:hypothetical protein [Candidatus Eremiobacteraeota bacterium]